MLQVLAAVAYVLAIISPGNTDVEALMPWRGWAAFVPNADRTIGMGWGATSQEAEEKALAACRKKSLTCAETAATTKLSTDRVALVCCRQPNVGCAIGIAPSNEEAVSTAEAFVESQEWGRCEVRALYSARTGFKQ
jgi:hypothetical protein